MSYSNSFRSKLSRKKKKYSSMLFRETGIAEVDLSKYLMVCNAGLVSGIRHETIVDIFPKHFVQQVMMIPGKSYCFVELNDEKAAKKVLEDMCGKFFLSEVKGPLYLLPIERMPINSVINDCSKPDGLSVFYDFISDEEEQLLINLVVDELDNSGNSLKHRVVKHYGYSFDYKTNNVDKTDLNCKPIPKQLNFILQRLKNCDSRLDRWIPDQLTVNFYHPGQGIPQHVDTHSAFDDIILSLSLGSNVVMDFKNFLGQQYSCRLPRKSLLIMADESRYGWNHGITPRKYDTVSSDNGLTTQKRDTRISFTFRKTLNNHFCRCLHSEFCDSQKVLKKVTPFSIDNEIASELERIHVHEVYEEIAIHFSETRHKPWPNVESFVKSFDVGSIFVDIGCGNGKYLGLNSFVFQIGCDRSEKFVSECCQKGYEALMCDCLQLPFRSNAVDCCLCIAVIHHLSTEERRLAAIKEIVRILRPQGRALIYVWAKNQQHDEHSSSYLKQSNKNKRKIDEENDKIDHSHSVHFEKSPDNVISLPVHVNRTQFKYEDMLVPWKRKLNDPYSNNATTFLRYYHVFDVGELEKLCNYVDGLEIVKSYYDQGNWCVTLEKLS